MTYSFLNDRYIYSQTCISTWSYQDYAFQYEPLFYEMVSKEKQSYDQHNAEEATSFGFIFKYVVTLNLKMLANSCTWLHNNCALY